MLSHWPKLNTAMGGREQDGPVDRLVRAQGKEKIKHVCPQTEIPSWS